MDIKKGKDLTEFVSNNDWNESLEKYLEDLNCELKTHKDIKNSIMSAAKIFDIHDIEYNGDAYESRLLYHDGVIDLLEDSIEEFKSELKKKQSVCDHEMKEIGHDSHHTYYFCNKCGFEERV